MGSGSQVTEMVPWLLHVKCVALIGAIFPCFNLKPDDCNMAITILSLKLSQLHKTLLMGKPWLEFL